MDISDWRRKIDELDRQLVDLLNQRAACARAIGAIKRQRGLPVRESAREAEVFANVLSANQPGGLSNDALRRIFEHLLAEMRNLQR